MGDRVDAGCVVRGCGGCEGIGSHRRHCPRNPNYDRRLEWADAAEQLGDRIGPNNYAAANYCYAAAGLLREEARETGAT